MALISQRTLLLILACQAARAHHTTLAKELLWRAARTEEA